MVCNYCGCRGLQWRKTRGGVLSLWDSAGVEHTPRMCLGYRKMKRVIEEARRAARNREKLLRMVRVVKQMPCDGPDPALEVEAKARRIAGVPG